MNSSINFSWFFIFWVIPLFWNGQVHAQDGRKNWPIRMARTNGAALSYNATKVSQGYILLRNNDTLVGKMKILVYSPPTLDFVDFLAAGKNTRKDLVEVKTKEINYVRDYTDSFKSDSNFTDFVNLENKDLWRLLARENKISVYDDLLAGDPGYGYRMRLVSENKMIKIYGNSLFHIKGIKPLIVRFINHRYHTHFETGDFKDVKAMIDTILEK